MGLLNTVKNELADVSSVSPSSEQLLVSQSVVSQSVSQSGSCSVS